MSTTCALHINPLQDLFLERALTPPEVCYDTIERYMGNGYALHITAVGGWILGLQDLIVKAIKDQERHLGDVIIEMAEDLIRQNPTVHLGIPYPTDFVMEIYVNRVLVDPKAVGTDRYKIQYYIQFDDQDMDESDEDWPEVITNLTEAQIAEYEKEGKERLADIIKYK